MRKDKLKEENKSPIIGERILMGITKASLQTESFISAASFKEVVLLELVITGSSNLLHIRIEVI